MHRNLTPHTLKCVIAFATMLAISMASASASLITTLNFTDGNWTVFKSGNGGHNNSTFGSNFLEAHHRSTGNQSSGERLTANLTGSISTVGFENITLQFSGLTQETLEWNANMTTAAVSNADGLRIFGTGVEINANQANDISGTPAEAEFAAGTTFPTAAFGSDFAFDASADNGSISNLTFRLQVNNSNERLRVSNVQIFGDSVPIPEPSHAGLLALLCGGAIVMIRRREARQRKW
jgi:hypothetical protein